jgi:ribosomal protein S12 methylthiotransferase accessory factor
MLFWYRRPPTATLPIEYIEPAPLRNELRSLQALGFVVTVCQLIYDLDLPCFLVVAFRGADFAYGLGCETSPEEALGHAVRELGVRLRWLLSSAPRRILFKSMRSTSTPDDHYALYCRGPLHDVLRSALKQILVLPPATLPPRIANGSVKERLELLAAGLAERGFRIFWRDITAPEVAASGLRVIRVLVPGLIPLHFGFDRLRMGCQRLVGKNSPGRLCTLLPHFLA